jgi:hypothetical protein
LLTGAGPAAAGAAAHQISGHFFALPPLPNQIAVVFCRKHMVYFEENSDFRVR